MQAEAKSRESSKSAPSKPWVSLEAVVKSMWSCSSICSNASSQSHSSDVQTALTARKEALSGIKALKELLENKKPLPGVVIKPFNIKVIPPCKDCQFTGDNWDDLIAHAASNSTDHVSGPVYEGEKTGESVPVTENIPGYGAIDNREGCFEDSNYHFDQPLCCKDVMPLDLKHLFQQTSTSNEEENKTEAGDLSEKVDSEMKL